MNSKSRQIDLAKGLKLINNRIINNVIVGIKVGISCLEGNLAHTKKSRALNIQGVPKNFNSRNECVCEF